jgi:threonine dehydratase
MVGGRTQGLADEVVYRFEFPERPGALLSFLDGLEMDWNISLFHYRNHGADHGRVLVGIQVPPPDRPRFIAYIEGLGYPWWDENDNAAYHLFLD